MNKELKIGIIGIGSIEIGETILAQTDKGLVVGNELPQAPTQMCEPVYIGGSNFFKLVSTKKHKQSWYVFFGYFRFGRIKRMRKVEQKVKSKNFNVRTKRFNFNEVYGWVYLKCKITRWNKH